MKTGSTAPTRKGTSGGESSIQTWPVNKRSRMSLRQTPTRPLHVAQATETCRSHRYSQHACHATTRPSWANGLPLTLHVLSFLWPRSGGKIHATDRRTNPPTTSNLPTHRHQLKRQQRGLVMDVTSPADSPEGPDIVCGNGFASMR